jgi:hypothetical protein
MKRAMVHAGGHKRGLYLAFPGKDRDLWGALRNAIPGEKGDAGHQLMCVPHYYLVPIPCVTS